VKAPSLWCYACWCPCCLAFQQRTRLLILTQEPYICCAGILPCDFCNRPRQRCWLVWEVACCLQFAIAGNRVMIQTRFNRMSTACDRCLIWSTCLVACCTCIASIFVDIPRGCENIVDCLILLINSCMLTQQEIEIDTLPKVYTGVPVDFVELIPSKMVPYIKIQQLQAPRQMEMVQIVGTEEVNRIV
jgi:hypothetical protein